RIMLIGTAAPTEDPQARRRYLDRQPEAEMFAGFGDFAFYRVTLKAAHLVAGFGRIVDLKPREVLTETGDAAELLAAEPEILAHMNGDHADALRLYATKLLGAPDGQWRCVGCDPEGLELQLDRIALRLPFPQRVHARAVLRDVLKQMAEEARRAAWPRRRDCRRDASPSRAETLTTGGGNSMRRVLIAAVLTLAALPTLAAEDDIVLRGMGSFHVGGRIAEVSGRPVREIVRIPGGPPSKLDPNGQFMVEQMYVQ